MGHASPRARVSCCFCSLSCVCCCCSFFFNCNCAFYLVNCNLYNQRRQKRLSCGCKCMGSNIASHIYVSISSYQKLLLFTVSAFGARAHRSSIISSCLNAVLTRLFGFAPCSTGITIPTGLVTGTRTHGLLCLDCHFVQFCCCCCF